MDFLANSPIILIIITIVAICIGSFLNVVILRLPKVLDEQYHQEASQVLGIKVPNAENHPTENLNRRSACPHCHTPLKAWHNIPILSFIFLRGKCRFCHYKISFTYPTIEILSGALVFFIMWHFGINAFSLLLSILCFFLIVLTVIDLKHFILPDVLTLPLLWIGLLANSFYVFTTPVFSLWGAAIGYGTLWFTFWIFKIITQKEGLGYGDFKLMAALGAWFGFQSLLFIVLVSAVLGILFALLLSLIKRKKHFLIPFGPSIALTGVLYPVVGHELTYAYFSSCT